MISEGNVRKYDRNSLECAKKLMDSQFNEPHSSVQFGNLMFTCSYSHMPDYVDELCGSRMSSFLGGNSSEANLLH